MKKNIYKLNFYKLNVYKLIIATICIATWLNVNAKNIEVKSYGHYQKMIHMKKTTGVVNLKKAIPSLSGTYAVGAIQKGLGEITILNGKVWLDYGKDGLGNSLNNIPADEQAVLLAISKVEKWQSTKIKNALSQEKLFKVILEKAEKLGLNIKMPFQFLLEGSFDELAIHVISGQDPKFGGHGGATELFKKAEEKRNNQKAIIIGFYSADNQGVFTHPGESWHLHAVIKKENIGAHVDSIATGKNVTLKLPSQN